VIAKGIDRTAEEIGRALPKASILVSSGNKQMRSLPRGNHVVFATTGSEPNDIFTAVVMLDGEKIFNRPSLRAEELAKFSWFYLLSKAKPNSEVYLSLPNHHPVVQAILRNESRYGVAEDLINREKAKLPPFYRIAVVTGDKFEISKFSENLKSSNSFEVTGPTSIDSTQSKVLIRATLQQGPMLVDLLDDITKIQGVKGRKIFNIRFDPFDL
jgi:primosomal protein N' (replication factor Y)